MTASSCLNKALHTNSYQIQSSIQSIDENENKTQNYDQSMLNTRDVWQRDVILKTRGE